MNIYEKLNVCRLALQEKKLKKSGKNSFSGYDYFELQDFLPIINGLFAENKLCAVVSFGQELATLTLIDAEKPEDKITFTSPMSEANLKGCHAVQNLGAVETYQRRYLYMTALEIVECDNLEPLTGKKEDDKSGESTGVKKLSDAQVKRAFAIASGKGYAADEVKRWALAKYKVTAIENMTKEQYEEFCVGMEKMEPKSKGA